MVIIWLQFFISAAIIIVAGVMLCIYADTISERTKLSKVWIGIILLGIVTSLPELVTSLSSVVKLAAYDLALGNIFGSVNFNLLIIVILDFLYKKASITSKADSNRSHIFSAGCSLILIIIAIVGIIINGRINILNIGNIGIDSILIALVYIVAIRLISRLKTQEVHSQMPSQNSESGIHKKTTLARSCLGFLIASIFVVASGMWLANIGREIACLTGWGQTFVGSIFLAMVTSFPELVVSISALKLGSIDMAFGNIFGSNMINLFIIPIIDIVYRKGAILAFVSQTHIITAMLAVFLTCIVMRGLLRQKKRTFFNLGWDTMIMLVIYLLGNYMLFRAR